MCTEKWHFVLDFILMFFSVTVIYMDIKEPAGFVVLKEEEEEKSK